MHLPRDPGPLGRGAQPPLLIAFELQPGRPLLQRRQQRPALRIEMPATALATPSAVNPIQYLMTSVGDHLAAAITAPASVTTAAAMIATGGPSSASQ